MALTEQRVLNQVTLLPRIGAINVQWSNQIIRDGEVITEEYERKSYSKEQKDMLMEEVEGAEQYISAIGW